MLSPLQKQSGTSTMCIQSPYIFKLNRAVTRKSVRYGIHRLHPLSLARSATQSGQILHSVYSVLYFKTKITNDKRLD